MYSQETHNCKRWVAAKYINNTVNKENINLWKEANDIEERSKSLLFLTHVDNKSPAKASPNSFKYSNVQIDFSMQTTLYPAADFTKVFDL